MLVRQSKNGIEYLHTILKDKKSVVTRAWFWRIPHRTRPKDVCLKIGRYKKDGTSNEAESLNPKSELTLEPDELERLLDFVATNYEPLRKDARLYIPLDGRQFDSRQINHLRALFENPDKRKVVDFITRHDLLPDAILGSLAVQKKMRAIEEFEKNLRKNLLEHDWQRWFKQNSWVLGSDYVEILEERSIDRSNIADYLMHAYDGFLDIIEIKRPADSLPFWREKKDHDNWVVSRELTAAIAQATKYIYEVEREANSVKFLERVKHIKAIKPRCVLIFGRSKNWNTEQREAYRILNASFHNLTILTYDHVLLRARRMLGLDTEPVSHEMDYSVSSSEELDDIPF